MSNINQLSQIRVIVKNAVGEEDNPQNAIDWYFKDGSIWTSAKCPSCGKAMYRKRFYGEQKHPIMVGAHVEITNIALFKGKKYIIPLCEECNNKKETLPPFKVAVGYLKLAPHST